MDPDLPPPHRGTADVPPGVERADLSGTLLQPHEQALAALDDPGVNSLAAVTWLSAHLAATEKCVYGVARRRLPDGAGLVRHQLEVDRRLHGALWRLDRRLTGDVHVAAEPVEQLEAAVRARLEEHASGERALLARLEPLLEEEERAQLLEQNAAALEQAPTRPHPNTSHHRWVSGAMFRLDALADRWRDLMDNRDVPTPHQVPLPRRPGRWGSYLMGRPYGAPGTGAPEQSDREGAAR